MLNASMLPSLAKYGGGMRGAKKPGTPKAAAALALSRFSDGRKRSNDAGGMSGEADETMSQNSASRSTRAAAELPAMSAALMAPMETPVTQSSSRPASARPS